MNTQMLSITLQEIKSDCDDIIDIIGKKTGKEFLADDFAFNSCSLLLGEIAGLVKNIPEEFRTLHPEVHWRDLEALEVFTQQSPSLSAVASGVAAGAASDTGSEASGSDAPAGDMPDDRRRDPQTALLIDGIRLHIPTIYNFIVRFLGRS